MEEEENRENNGQIDRSVMEPIKSTEEEPPEGIDTKNEVKRKADDEPAKSARKNVTKNEENEPARVSSSHDVRYYLKHRIDEKLIKGLVENQKEEDIGGNFEIPCNIGGLKHMNALVDQGSYVNVMPLSIYKKLTDERPAETDIRLSLASHSYIYPLGIAEDVLVDVAGYVYLVDFVILDIRGDEKRPFILGTPFLTIAKAVIKFDKGTITLKSGKSKISFHRIPEPNCRIEKGIKNDIEPIAPTMTVKLDQYSRAIPINLKRNMWELEDLIENPINATTMIVNRLILEWEEKIKLHQEKKMKFDQWRSKIFNNEHLASVKEECEVDAEGGVT
ncbi:MAK10-like protein [Tanacetum coccineum]